MSFNGMGREISAWRRKIKLFKNETMPLSAVGFLPQWFAEGRSLCLEAGLLAGQMMGKERRWVSHGSAPAAVPQLQLRRAVGEPWLHGRHRHPERWMLMHLPHLHGWERCSLATCPDRTLPTTHGECMDQPTMCLFAVETSAPHPLLQRKRLALGRGKHPGAAPPASVTPSHPHRISSAITSPNL